MTIILMLIASVLVVALGNNLRKLMIAKGIDCRTDRDAIHSIAIGNLAR